MATITLRPATPADLDAINSVIERAVLTWPLPERVKRLTLPSYRYQPHDLDHLKIMVAENSEHGVIGVAAWGPAALRDLPAGKTGLLLHGLYVDPERQRQGVGRKLLDVALRAAREQGFDGLLVKVQPGAEGFFLARGLERVPTENPGRDYPHRFWAAVAPDN
jgi:GNAT superfamily N-acetyltransferase